MTIDMMDWKRAKNRLYNDDIEYPIRESTNSLRNQRVSKRPAKRYAELPAMGVIISPWMCDFFGKGAQRGKVGMEGTT
jgi:hypothetical protein